MKNQLAKCNGAPRCKIDPCYYYTWKEKGINRPKLCKGRKLIAKAKAGVKGKEYDIQFLTYGKGKLIADFWITETQARAIRVSRWIKDGILILKSDGYPYQSVVSFNAKKARES